MLYNMFCIFIGVTFANLGREEGGIGLDVKPDLLKAQKRTTIKTKNAPTHHEPAHKGELEDNNETDYL